MKNVFIGLNTTAILFAFLISGFAITGAQAQPGDRPHHLGRHDSKRVVEHLGLDETQAALLQQAREARQSNQDELRQLQQQLRALPHSDSYTYTEAEMLVNQINQLKANQILAHANAENAFYQSLTAEQKALLAERRERRTGSHLSPKAGPGIF